MDFILRPLKRIKVYLIYIFLFSPSFFQGQDMQQLLNLTYDKSIIEQTRSKDTLTYTAKDHFQWGMFEVANRNYDKALQHFEKIANSEKVPINDLELAYFMGRSEAGLRNFKKSKAHFEKLFKNGISPIILMTTPETYLEVYRELSPLCLLTD